MHVCTDDKLLFAFMCMRVRVCVRPRAEREGTHGVGKGLLESNHGYKFSPVVKRITSFFCGEACHFVHLSTEIGLPSILVAICVCELYTFTNNHNNKLVLYVVHAHAHEGDMDSILRTEGETTM